MRFDKTINRIAISRKIIDVLIALFWLFLISDAYFQGRELPHLLSKINLPEFPLILSFFAVLTLAASACILIFWQRKNLMDEMPVLSSRVDRFFGPGAYSRFTHRLRPVQASIFSSIVFAAVGLHATYQQTQDMWSYMICTGFLFFAICMFIAYLVSKRFPPVLS